MRRIARGREKGETGEPLVVYTIEGDGISANHSGSTLCLGHCVFCICMSLLSSLASPDLWPLTDHGSVSIQKSILTVCCLQLNPLLFISSFFTIIISYLPRVSSFRTRLHIERTQIINSKTLNGSVASPSPRRLHGLLRPACLLIERAQTLSWRLCTEFCECMHNASHHGILKKRRLPLFRNSELQE